MPKSTSTAWLVGFEGKPNEIHYELTSAETVIGRGSDCDIQLEDKLVSRRHALIRFVDDDFEIEDLDSSNGTYLNNERVGRSPILNGDRPLR